MTERLVTLTYEALEALDLLREWDQADADAVISDALVQAMLAREAEGDMPEIRDLQLKRRRFRLLGMTSGIPIASGIKADLVLYADAGADQPAPNTDC